MPRRVVRLPLSADAPRRLISIRLPLYRVYSSYAEFLFIIIIFVKLCFFGHRNYLFLHALPLESWPKVELSVVCPKKVRRKADSKPVKNGKSTFWVMNLPNRPKVNFPVRKAQLLANFPFGIGPTSDARLGKEPFPAIVVLLRVFLHFVTEKCGPGKVGKVGPMRVM